MVISAAKARELSSNSEGVKQVLHLIDEAIKKACRNGRYDLNVSLRLRNHLTSDGLRMIGEELGSKGYSVDDISIERAYGACYDRYEVDTFEVHISWGKNEEEPIWKF